MTGIYDRYEVGCSVCGVICFSNTLLDALETAQKADQFHRSRIGETVTIYDRLTHQDCPRIFSADGTITSCRRANRK